MPYDIQELVREDHGAHASDDLQKRTGAETSAQPKGEPITSQEALAERGGGRMKPVTQRATAAAKPSARRRVTGNRSTSASDGIAQRKTADHSTAGDPTPSDPANVVAPTAYLLPGQDDGRPGSDAQNSVAVVPLSEPAKAPLPPSKVSRARRSGQSTSASRLIAAAPNPSGPVIHVVEPIRQLPGQGGVQCSHADHALADAADLSAPADHAADAKPDTLERGDDDTTPGYIVATPSDPADVPVTAIERSQDRGDGHSTDGAPSTHAVATIVDLWRQRCAIQRTAISVSLQAQAMCRRVLGDKDAARKEWSLIQKGKGTNPDLAMVVEPYRQMVDMAEAHAKGLEKQLTKLVRKLPLWTWAKDVRGLGELSVAGIIGGASGNPGDYKSVSALWKRFGLAVFDGQRQRRVADPDLNLLYGYNPERRAFAYVVACNLMKSQKVDVAAAGRITPKRVRELGEIMVDAMPSDPNDPGSCYRALYDRRKAYEMEERADPVPKAHAHNRALRVMVKALFKDVWVMDRRLRAEAVEP